MKATGIVRRIDDLGRVVIPKEIRRTLRIREGDPLEIYTEKGGEVIFKKYSPMGDLHDFAQQVCEAVTKNTGFAAAVCDRDSVIAAAGPGKKELLDRHLAQGLIRKLEERETFLCRGQGLSIPLSDSGGPLLGAAVPILAEGDLLGGVLLTVDPEKGRFPGDFELRLIQTVAAFLGRQMEM